MVWCAEAAHYYISGQNVTADGGAATGKFVLSSAAPDTYLSTADVTATRAAAIEAAAAAKAGEGKHHGYGNKYPQITSAATRAFSGLVATPATAAAGKRREREEGTRKAAFGLVGRLAAAHQSSPWLSPNDRAVLSSAAVAFHQSSSTSTAPASSSSAAKKGAASADTSSASSTFPATSASSSSSPSHAHTIPRAVATSQIEVAAHTGQLMSILYRSMALVATEEMEHRGLAVAVDAEGIGSGVSSAATGKAASSSSSSSKPATSTPSATATSTSAALPTLAAAHEGVAHESAQYMALATKGLLEGYQRREGSAALAALMTGGIAAAAEAASSNKKKGDKKAATTTTLQQRSSMIAREAAKQRAEARLLLARQQSVVATSMNVNSTQHVCAALYGGCVPVMASVGMGFGLGVAGAGGGFSSSDFSTSSSSIFGGGGAGGPTPLLIPQPPLHSAPAIAQLVLTGSSLCRVEGGKRDASASTGEEAAKLPLAEMFAPYVQQQRLHSAASSTQQQLSNDSMLPVESILGISGTASASSSAVAPLVTIIRISAALSPSSKTPNFISSLRITRNDRAAVAEEADTTVSSILPPAVLLATNVCVEGIAGAGERPLSAVLEAISSTAAAPSLRFLPTPPTLAETSELLKSAVGGRGGGGGDVRGTDGDELPAPIILISVDGDTRTEMALHQSGIIDAVKARIAAEWAELSPLGRRRAYAFAQYATTAASAADASESSTTLPREISAVAPAAVDVSPAVLVLTEERLFAGMGDAASSASTTTKPNNNAKGSKTAATAAPTPKRTFDFGGMAQFERNAGGALMGGGSGGAEAAAMRNGAVPRVLWAALPLTEQLTRRLGVRSYAALMAHLAARVGNSSSSKSSASSNPSSIAPRNDHPSRAFESVPSVRPSTIPITFADLRKRLAAMPDPFFSSCPTEAHATPSSQRSGSFSGIVSLLPRHQRSIVFEKRDAAENSAAGGGSGMGGGAGGGFGGGGGGINAANSGNSAKGGTDEMLEVIIAELSSHFATLAGRTAHWAAIEEESVAANAAEEEALKREAEGNGALSAAEAEELFANLDEVDIDGFGEAAADLNALLFDSSPSSSAAVAKKKVSSSSSSSAAAAALTKKRISIHTAAALARAEERLETLRSAIIGLKALQAYRGTEKIRAWVAPQSGQMARFLVAPEPTTTTISTTSSSSSFFGGASVNSNKKKKTSVNPTKDEKKKNSSQLVAAPFPILRPSFVHHGTATGRLLCRDPNLQNIPKGTTAAADFDRVVPKYHGPKTTNGTSSSSSASAAAAAAADGEEGFSVRRLLSSRFVPALPPSSPTTTAPSTAAAEAAAATAAGGTIVEVDYSQLEPVAAAAITRDPALLEEVNSGIDQHCKRVALFLGRPYDEVYRMCRVVRDPTYIEHRQKMKVFSFQRQFGAGPRTISNTTGLSVAVVQKLIDDEKRIYAGVEAFHRLAEECSSPRSLAVIEAARALWMGPERAAFIRTLEGGGGSNASDNAAAAAIGNSGGGGTSATSISTLANVNGGSNGLFPLASGAKFCFARGASATRIRNHPTQGFAAELVQSAVGMAFVHLLRRNALDDVVLVNTVHDSLWLDCRVTLDNLKQQRALAAAAAAKAKSGKVGGEKEAVESTTAAEEEAANPPPRDDDEGEMVVGDVLAELEAIMCAILPIYQQTFSRPASSVGGMSSVGGAISAPGFGRVGLMVEAAAGPNLANMGPLKL